MRETDASIAPKPSRVMPAISSSPWPGVRIASASPCHLPNAKNPAALTISARTCSG